MMGSALPTGAIPYRKHHGWRSSRAIGVVSIGPFHRRAHARADPPARWHPSIAPAIPSGVCRRNSHRPTGRCLRHPPCVMACRKSSSSGGRGYAERTASGRPTIANQNTRWFPRPAANRTTRTSSAPRRVRVAPPRRIPIAGTWNTRRILAIAMRGTPHAGTARRSQAWFRDRISPSTSSPWNMPTSVHHRSYCRP